jgi:hypothetical protein
MKDIFVDLVEGVNKSFNFFYFLSKDPEFLKNSFGLQNGGGVGELWTI